MTSEQPDAATSATQPPPATGRPLRRRATDRVIGGVAAGIADYLNVDPLLIRALFVGLMIFGGTGLVLYVGAWLLIPVEARDDSIVDSTFRHLGVGPGRLITIILIIVAVLYVIVPGRGVAEGSIGLGDFYLDARVLLILVIVLLGIMLLRRGGSRIAAAATPSADVVAPARAQLVAYVPLARPRVPRGPLGWYTLASALVGIGLLALVDNATDATVVPGQFFGLALAIVGIGLVIGSWWGNARLMILPALLVLPIAWAASYVTVPLEGGTGSVRFAPVSADELRDEYRLMAGQLILDLRELEAGSEPMRIAASVAFGELVVILPTEAQLEIDSQVGAGGFGIFNNWQGGTSLTDRFVRGDAGPHFVLDLGAGIGQISVYAFDEGQ